MIPDGRGGSFHVLGLYEWKGGRDPQNLELWLKKMKGTYLVEYNTTSEYGIRTQN
jgi:hypothetical protein